jgi:glutathione S-transferase
MLTLYHGATAVCAAKVRVTLAEKDIPYHSRPINLHTGEQFNPEYMKLNPNAAVPTIVHDGKVLTESTVINEYLDDVFPHQPLRPSDAYGRARVRLWTKREDTIHDAINTMTASILFRAELLQKPFEERKKRYEKIPDLAKRAKWAEIMEHGIESHHVDEALARFAKLFRDIEKALTSGPWLTGDEFTLADVGLISFFYRLEMLECGGLWHANFPSVPDWFERCKARASFRIAILEHIPPPAFDSYRAHSSPVRANVESRFQQVLKRY